MKFSLEASTRQSYIINEREVGKGTRSFNNLLRKKYWLTVQSPNPWNSNVYKMIQYTPITLHTMSYNSSCCNKMLQIKKSTLTYTAASLVPSHLGRGSGLPSIDDLCRISENWLSQIAEWPIRGILGLHDVTLL